MTILKYYKHQGNISDISRHYNAFSRLSNARLTYSQNREWRNTQDGSLSSQLLVAFFGKTGYGKSSTVNAFFGNAIMETSDISACTRVCNSLDFELSPGHYLSLGDFPGVGESQYRDIEYLAMYKNFMKHATVVVYVVRADTRDYSIDESAYKTLFKEESERNKVIFALNFCDKVEPVSRVEQKVPTTAQMESINNKISSINSIFKPVNKVIPYSSATGWNMNKLANELVDVVINSGDLVLQNVAVSGNAGRWHY